VGICASNSLDTVAGVLGILKAGAAYVPLDPTMPWVWRRRIIEHANTGLLLTTEALEESFPPTVKTVLCLDRDGKILEKESTDNPPNLTSPDNLACVLYRSGPNRTVKGIAIEHRNLLPLTNWGAKTFTAHELSGVLMSNPIWFDLSLFQIFVPLCSGGTLLIADGGLQPAMLANMGVKLIHTAPSIISKFIEAWRSSPSSTCTINLAGEPVSESLVSSLQQQPGVQGVNVLYGPTEASTITCLAQHSTEERLVPARPIANQQVYILDAYQNLTPIGVSGEIYIGGPAVARGYLNEAELTAQRMVPHPFSADPAARLFRSGDRGRYLKDGTIEFLGRFDEQLRICGFLFSPSDIESELAEHPDVHQCIVTMRPCDTGGQELAAFVVFHEGRGAAPGDLSDFLARKLPAYMIPADFIFMDKLPLLPSGKVDRSNLPGLKKGEPEPEAEEARAITPTEKILSEIWAEVIGLKEVGIHDNFFELGGHSVLVTQIIARVRKAFHIDLSLRTVFEFPTIVGLAEQIEQALINEIEDIPEQEAQQLSDAAALVTQEMR
jgi:amino acid adenylation domain-containing protein